MTDARAPGPRGTPPSVSRSSPRAGFTLIELMVVIAVIAIIAAIAIPNLMAARKASNEAAVISNLRSIAAAQVLFRERDADKNGTHDYAFSVVKLVTSGLLDNTFATAERQGYFYEVFTPGEALDEWQCLAYPTAPGKSGDRTFYIDESSVIRQNTTGFAGPTDPAIGG